MAFTTGRGLLGGWVKQLIDAGVVPPSTRRILIDIDHDATVKVYYECYGDEKMFTAELAVALEKAEVVSASMADAPASEPASPDEPEGRADENSGDRA